MSHKKFYQLTMITVLWLWVLIVITFFMYAIHEGSRSLEDGGKIYIISFKTGKVLLPKKIATNIPLGDEQQVIYHKNPEEEGLVIPKSFLAILITDLGLNSHATNFAIDLPSDVTLGFSPYAKRVGEFLKIATDKKHKLLMNIPMEFSDDFQDAGPLAVTSDYKSLDFILNSYSHYLFGLYTEPGEVFSRDVGAMEILLSKLREKRLILCYSGSNPEIKKISDGLKVVLMQPNMIIDDKIEANQLKDKLLQINEQLVGKDKKFLLSISASVGNLTVLSEWLMNSTKGFVVVPIDMLF